MNRNRLLLLISGGVFLMACSLSSLQSTAIPNDRPVNFDVQTVTPTSEGADRSQPTDTPAEAPLALDDASSDSPPAEATPTLIPVPDETPTPVIIPTNTPAYVDPTATPEPLPTEPPPAPPTEPPANSETEAAAEATVEPLGETTEAESPAADFTGELDPPLAGGAWNFEADFVLWENPYGHCSGALVGAGWTAFVENGPQGSSCMGENLYGQDVQSGAKSQEITFDFIAANSGILRTIDTRPGHRYQIVAHGKHIRSLAPVQLFLGVDMTGGTDWEADSVTWYEWDDPAEDIWKATEETVTATGEKMTIFIRGWHPAADQGGKTFIDNVSITHLGP